MRTNLQLQRSFLKYFDKQNDRRSRVLWCGRYTAHMVGWIWLTQAGFTQARAGELSYWYRSPRGSAQAASPVVLLHGIGLGLVPYLGMLHRIKSQHGRSSTIICPVKGSSGSKPNKRLLYVHTIMLVCAGISAYRTTILRCAAIVCCNSCSYPHHALPPLPPRHYFVDFLQKRSRFSLGFTDWTGHFL